MLCLQSANNKSYLLILPLEHVLDLQKTSRAVKHYLGEDQYSGLYLLIIRR